MAIIRNDRRAREEQAEAQKADDESDQMVTDYSWHPSLEEFDPQLTVDDWRALLDDPSVFDEDGLHAVECLHEIGGPTTLQQLSVRYRGTMGRYRKWLNTTAERVGRHLGMEAPQHDQFGNEEWWPLLYQRRGIGKAAANQHELRLRDELAQALDARDAEKKQAHRREEQSQAEERERQLRAQAEALKSPAASGSHGGSQREAGQAAAPSAAEQRRAAQEARAAREARLSQITVDRTTESVPEIDIPEQQPAPKPAMTKAQAAVAARIAAAQKRVGGRPSAHTENSGQPEVRPAATDVTTVEAPQDQPVTSGVVQEPASVNVAQPVGPQPKKKAIAAESSFPFDAVKKYLSAVRAEHPESAGRGASSARSTSRRKRGGAASEQVAVHMPLDYAVRYSNRAWKALDLIAASAPEVTAAQIARLMQCDSVEPLQQLLNGEEIPSFALVDGLSKTLGLNHAYLEAADADEPELPIFATVQELTRDLSLEDLFDRGKLTHLYVLKTNDDSQRATIVLQFGTLRCFLLDRYGVLLSEDDDASRSAFLALVQSLQEYALRTGVGFENISLSPKEWRALRSGRAWPGSVVE